MVVEDHGFKWKSIDHIDGAHPLNNCMSNLRDGSNGVNARNMRLSVRNKSGINGVLRTPTHWIARWREEGKVCTRSFAPKIYGEEPAKQMAIQARAAADLRTGTTNGYGESAPLRRKRAAVAAELAEREEAEQDD